MQKVYKALNVPDKPHPVAAVLVAVADVAIVEAHEPNEVAVKLWTWPIVVVRKSSTYDGS